MIVTGRAGIEPVTSSTQVRTYTTKRFEQLGNVFFLNLHDLKYHILGKYRNFKGGGVENILLVLKQETVVETLQIPNSNRKKTSRENLTIRLLQ